MARLGERTYVHAVFGLSPAREADTAGRLVLLQDWEPTACVRAANLIAARALAGTGDWETLPHLDEVERELTALAVPE